MTLSRELGLPLTTCMRETSNRQFILWSRWLLEELSNPSRSDHYLMQIALSICRANAKDEKTAKALSLKDFKLQFEQASKSGGAPIVDDPKLASELAKASWFKAAGLKGTVDGNRTGKNDRQNRRGLK